MARLINDPVVAGFTAQIPFPYPPIEARRFVAFCMRDFGSDISANFVLVLRSNPRLIAGGAGFTWKAGEIPEIGYWIAAPYRRRGFAGEAARALVQRIFSSGDAQAVCAWVHMRNPASQRVLKRAGFRAFGGGMRHSRSLGRYVPTTNLQLDRATWRKRQKRG